MKKTIYVMTGVLAVSIAGVAMSQDRGMMRGMDTNENGTVEKSEFDAMMDKRFAETDANGGGITLEEYQAKAEADAAKWQEAREARRKEKEEKRAEKTEERSERMAERMKSRFERLDENGDGVVTAEEYKAAGDKMFERMDRDGDGILNDRHRREGRRGHDRKGDRT
ncbi:EF-hand domain-containing protein [Pseudemcibacter aquimaris]|uniref:EF-hand domain-containing protein n=1 Tax=Pseudemcibacter aquimaris TaxID=2857064 RepID=UPI00201290CD|nr:hypothetical protein [Pseudemcibacter aquimaris]MCC3860647.1 hypothetical protein [Pseudemcibacter aquimaris]WDU59466.1 hypothetical protein KW060_04235 [Pseudemcibacter aquimaris]